MKMQLDMQLQTQRNTRRNKEKWKDSWSEGGGIHGKNDRKRKLFDDPERRAAGMSAGIQFWTDAGTDQTLHILYAGAVDFK